MAFRKGLGFSILVFCLILLSVLVVFVKLNSKPGNSIEQLLSPLTSTPSDAVVAPLIPTPTPTPTKRTQVSIIFAGDMMFDRHIREKATAMGNYDYILADFFDLFTNADLVVANLEGPVTNFPSKSVGSAVGSTNNYYFTFDPVVLATLNKYNIKLVNLGNNHINNFGQAGLEQTMANLQAAKINYFGAVGGQVVQNRIYYWQIPLYADVQTESQQQYFTVAFVNFNQFVDQGLELAFQDLKTARGQADFVIVYPHWGNEYVTTASAPITTWARQLIDAGADLIIGGHPHVVQQSEIYQGKTIYYSLGNTVFDQYFEPAVQNGLLVKINLDLQTKQYTSEEFKTLITKTGKTEWVK